MKVEIFWSEHARLIAQITYQIKRDKSALLKKFAYNFTDGGTQTRGIEKGQFEFPWLDGESGWF